MAPFAVSLAFWRDGQPLCHDAQPAFRELSPLAMGGARNGRAIAHPASAGCTAPLVTGGHATRETGRLLARWTGCTWPRRRCIIGCASLALCFVAAELLDAYGVGLAPWDLAAGVLLVTEAGGQVSSTAGGPLRLQDGEVAASNGRIHAELLKQLQG
jgi:myo-inositol-1(or 4)-monophosphatase